MNNIIPAILAKDASDLKEKISQLPDEIKFIHFDVLEEDIWTDINIDFEVHLMVSHPEEITERWINRGVKRIIIHQLNDTISKLKSQVEIGLAVKLDTPIEEIFSLVPEVNFIHLMSIAEIGEQGHLFKPIIFDKIKKVREKFSKIVISVDGGINITNYQALKDFGVDRFIVGSGFKDLWESLTKK